MNETKPKRNHSVKRERILELLRSSCEHPTADWIYERLKKEFPDLSLGTVYRNLRILAEEGQILSLRFGSTFDRFDGDLEPHQHLTCERCGKVHDLQLNLDKDFLQNLEEKTGYKIPVPHLALIGICPDCQRKEENSK